MNLTLYVSPRQQKLVEGARAFAQLKGKSLGSYIFDLIEKDMRGTDIKKLCDDARAAMEGLIGPKKTGKKK